VSTHRPSRLRKDSSSDASDSCSIAGHLQIVRGEPTPEELAALTAIVTAAGADTLTPPAQPQQRGRWVDPAYAHRQLWRVGPGGWRAGAHWG
jgi:Acyl-CoA carboxylase epsilon subunit